MSTRWLRFEHLHQPGGWLSPGYLGIDALGRIAGVEAQAPAGQAWERGGTFAVPGMPNLHSHAFQRAIAGFGERCGVDAHADSFWTWREHMYDAALRLTPEQLHVIAQQLYIEMLEVGMTSVAEFHYLHHAPDGQPYAPPTELALRVAAAAQDVGIRQTLLPVFYAHAGIGQPLSARQRRFAHVDVEGFMQLVGALRAHCAERTRVGIAPHSLRAVSASELDELVRAVRAMDAAAPIHLHIAEQSAEVQQVTESYGRRPVQWLLERDLLDAHWCLVHATHCDGDELRGLAESGAVVGLCPQTEANLGDGIFPLLGFLEHGGRFGVGSDSHIRVSVAAELRLLEYAQRLVGQRRNVAATPQPAAWTSTGRRLYDEALAGGAQALAQPVGELRPGAWADLVVLDSDHARMVSHGPESVFDAWIFSASDAAVKDVMVGGQWVVHDGRHVNRDGVRRRFAGVMNELWSRA